MISFTNNIIILTDQKVILLKWNSVSKPEIYTCKLIQFLSKVGSPNELAFHGEERFFDEILTGSPGKHIRPLCEISQETNQFEILSETNSEYTYF